jgi:hypothetical protein
MKMSAQTRSKKGISTVLTTIIIVVASIVLGTAVTVFGTGLFQTGAKADSMSISNTHMWVNTGSATPQVEGVMAVRNSGDELFAIEGIKVRNVIVPFTNWAVSPTSITAAQAAADFMYLNSATTPNAFPPAPGPTNYDLDGSGTVIPAAGIALTAQTDSVSLYPGQTVIVYFTVPGTIVSAADIGGTTSLTVSAGQLTAVQSIPVGSANV